MILRSTVCKLIKFSLFFLLYLLSSLALIYLSLSQIATQAAAGVHQSSSLICKLVIVGPFVQVVLYYSLFWVFDNQQLNKVNFLIP